MPLTAATVWNGSGDGLFWDDAANWGSGIPTSSVDAVIPDIVGGTLGIGGVDSGTDAAAKSVTVEATSGAFVLISAGTEKLNLSGNFINDAANLVTIDSDVNFLANSTLDGPIAFNGIANVDLRNITTQGTVTFANTISVQMNSLASFGRFALGAGSLLELGGATISFSVISTYTGNNGDLFQLVQRNA